MKKVNHTAIGAFVVGALFLVIVGVLLLGSGTLFAKKVLYTVSFNKSVKGLSVGSPVMFRGIKIGEVKDIRLACTPMVDGAAGYPSGDDGTAPKMSSQEWPVSVTLKLYPDSLVFKEDSAYESWISFFDSGTTEKTLHAWITAMVCEHGLRAQLQTQSLLTGMLYIELDLFPDEQSTDAIVHQIARYELPTRATAIDQIYQSLNSAAFRDRVNRLLQSFDKVETFFTDGGLDKALDSVKEIIGNTKETLGGVKQLLASLNQSVPGMLDDAGAVLHEVRLGLEGTMPKIRNIVNQVNSGIESLGGMSEKVSNGIQDVTGGVNTVLKNINDLLTEAKKMSSQNSPMREELSHAMEDLRTLLQSLGELVRMLNERPEVLIYGK